MARSLADAFDGVIPSDRLGLYFDAARHMRAEQLLGRLRRIVPPKVIAPRARSAPPWSPRARGIGVRRAPQSGPTPAPHVERAFMAVGARRTFDAPELWTNQSDGILFLFHLHGFSGLAAYAGGERSMAGDAFWAEVVGSWLTANATPNLPGWHPFPTSGRIIAWCAALSAIERWPHALRQAVAASVWRQTGYLRRAMERDIGGNHLLHNAAALVAAGALFPASAILPRGVAALERELKRQLLRDGGHEERSTSYHREVIELVADVVELVRRDGRLDPRPLTASLNGCLRWQAAIAGPDGRLPLLNDAWDGPPVARDTSDLNVLGESGYIVARHRSDQLVFDAGAICPPHLPPHAHADVLSFVLWLDGKPVIVDPGSYAYTGPWRDSFRATAAHNTVEVDGRDQCRFWGDFRAAYHPGVGLVPVRRENGLVVLGGHHDGYRKLASPVMHERRVVWWPEVGVVIVDRLSGRGRHRVRSPLHLAPEIEVDGGAVAGPIEVRPLNGGALHHRARRDGRYAPFIGTLQRTTVVEQIGDVEAQAPFGWTLLRPGAEARLTGDVLTVTRPREEVRTIAMRWVMP
jgi:Heparinase II/III-like protein/Heparinase II/III N-terminus